MTEGLDHDIMLALFNKEKFLSDEFSVLHTLIHSTITPDTLEGMHRSGSVFGVATPDPKLFVDILERDLISGLRVAQSRSSLIFSFWRRKSDIYKRFINAPRTVEFESKWSRAIQNACARMSLVDTLELSEDEVLNRAGARICQKYNVVQRYKTPLIYSFADAHKKKRSFESAVPLEMLPNILTKT